MGVSGEGSKLVSICCNTGLVKKLIVNFKNLLKFYAWFYLCVLTIALLH